jgi:hypothetical protein
MAGLIICAIVVSLSNLVEPAADGDSTGEVQVYTTPVYVAVLVSFIMPLTCLVQGLITKYALVTLKVNSKDFSFCYYLLMSIAWQIVGIVYFSTHKGSFDWGKWIFGFASSICNAAGCLFVQAAIATGEPMGPISALIMG